MSISVIHETRKLHELLGNSFEYKVPGFQRNYAWDLEEWEDLWEDILAIEENARQGKSGEHYMGYLVLQEQAQAPREFVIVDGQQRITTLCLMAMAVVNSLHGDKRQYIIRRRYLEAETISGDALVPKSKLHLNRTNRNFYQRLLELQSIDSMARIHRSNRKMHAAFNFFEKKLTEKFGKSESYETDKNIFKFYDELVGTGIFFTVLKVKDDESAFVIFETLNARGMELSSPDLLKNRLFSILQHSAESEYYMDQFDARWQEVGDNLRSENFTTFLKHYWNSRYDEHAREKKLYRIVRKQLETPQAVFSFLDEMNAASDLYVRMRNPNDVGWNQEALRYLSMLKIYQVDRHYPLLLAAYKKWGRKKEFVETARICAIIAFRWVVIGNLSPNELDSAFLEAAKAVRNGAQNAPELLRILESVYLSDERFRDSFAEFNIATGNNQELARHILSVLESGDRNLSSSQIMLESTLEHILPKNPDEGWDDFDDRDVVNFIWRLGNLALLEADKNREAGNRPFEAKREIYKSSEFNLTRKCAEYAEWTPGAISQRQHGMAEAAVEIWKI